MEYVELVQERLATYEAERKHIAQAYELRRLGITSAPSSPLARLDGFLIRVSKGASERQARREYRSDERELA